MGGLLQAGAVPIVLPLTSDREILTLLTGHLDGFFFTDGQDVSPEIYKGINLNICGECCPERDSMETVLLNIAMETDRPVLGISGVCELSPRLKCMAASEDGLVEAVCCPEQTFLWAVQWHPEFSYKVSEESREIFSAFVRACR